MALAEGLLGRWFDLHLSRCKLLMVYIMIFPRRHDFGFDGAFGIDVSFFGIVKTRFPYIPTRLRFSDCLSLYSFDSRRVFIKHRPQTAAVALDSPQAAFSSKPWLPIRGLSMKKILIRLVHSRNFMLKSNEPRQLVFVHACKQKATNSSTSTRTHAARLR